MTAIVTLLTVFGFSTAQFYFNLGDSVILIAAALFGPIPAMIAGGLGSFFADLAVYPATMFFTLVIKGLEGLICGLLLNVVYRYIKQKVLRIVLSILSMAFSAFFMMTGYFVCQTFLYGTYGAAIIALPMDAVQAACSTAVAAVVLYAAQAIKFREKLRFRSPVRGTEYVRETREDN